MCDGSHGRRRQRTLFSTAAARIAQDDSAAPEGNCGTVPRDRRISDDAPPGEPCRAARKRRDDFGFENGMVGTWGNEWADCGVIGAAFVPCGGV